MDEMEKRLKKGDELAVTVDSLAFGGKGVARLRGFVLFVEGAVPGDRVRAAITRAKPSYAEAHTIEVLSPSRSRTQAQCRHFGICGGCSWQTLVYEEQLRYKQQQVSDCLGHIGGLAGYDEDEPLAADPLWRYRNKVEFSFAPGGDGIELGFHLPGQWQRVVDIKDCLLHSALTNQVRGFVRDFAGSAGAEVYNQRTGQGFWRHLVLREGLNTGEVMVNVVTAKGVFPKKEHFADELQRRFPQVTSAVWSVNETRAAVAGGFPFTVLAGNNHIHERLCGLDLKLSPSAFLQTNTQMAERLYRRALDYACLSGNELVLDLYSGIGSIALLFAGHSRRVIGAEIMEEAVRLAEENCVINQISNATFIAGKVRSVLKDLQLDRRPDVVILDPPRAGASKKEVQRILELGAPRIVYVSCNASTLAGNARQLVEGGYRLVRAGAVDMFPHTPHIEVVALLEAA